MRVIPLSAVLILSLGLSAGTVSAFSDVDLSSDLGFATDRLQQRGVIGGYADGRYRPEQLVTRAEFVKATAIAIEGGGVIDGTGMNCFADFRGGAQWYWGYACRARERGWIGGYGDGSFGGGRFVTIAEALKISFTAFGVPLPQYFRAPDHWYDPYMDAASGMGFFAFLPRQPHHPLTRGEMALLLDALVTGGVGPVTPPPAPPPSCNGRQPGQTYLSGDGCNTCTCTQRGEICTLKACPYLREGARCFSSAECPNNQLCSTVRGDCRPVCSPGSQVCIMVCAGVCLGR